MKQKLYNKESRHRLQEKIIHDTTPRTTLSFYQYAQIDDPKQFRNQLYLMLDEIGILGRIYIATEGVNGQISVPTQKLDSFREQLNTIDFLKGIRLNIAREDDGKSFIKLIIKVRHKIVADGLDDSSFDVTKRGQHLSATEFNKLTAQDDTVIIDMRNHYESEVGHFDGAICPDVETFRESLPIVENILDPHRDKHIVMYCTGGIRCEKASAFFKHRGFEKVYQLDGGIIEYARQVAEQGLDNKFKGKNFVFDQRLGERISEEIISKCHQCGEPSDLHTNCANDACHILFIQCTSCAEKMHGCCSEKCSDFIELPEEDQKRLRVSTEFNGTKFGKGRYKAHRADHSLE